ncbi:MAG: MFS transporter [Candidatus Thermoplasmatota archaeon]|uniref:MFS transporter n=1 Tax=Candidatus Sysuiplasma superficiale TaxID=2823368 RepID=A0A8J7YMN3_9ARCH|nr:MFS transporter [Candidatus Sysuiplasma superficiale]MCL4347110.1 MFS transporter [Candidatus Thermoplasmatota archaeon]
MRNDVVLSARTLVISLGATAASMFVGAYGVLIGASASEMGWLQSSANSLSNGGQLLWGRLSDRFGKRKPFLFAGSLCLALLWFIMAEVRSPVQLIIAYASLSLISAMITVNWFSLIADITASSRRGHFLSVLNNIGSIGTLFAVVSMIFLLHGKVRSDIQIPFFAAVGSYLISAILVTQIAEKEHRTRITGSMRKTLSRIKQHGHFYRYFVAMNVQGFFWSMAWPIFPITIVTVMHFNLSTIAVLTSVSLLATIAGQYLIGRVVDRIDRTPMIFGNRLMLSAIPLFYALFSTYDEFILLELYSGIAGAIQNVVMNSYLMDIVPEGNKAEYISIMNGFNGMVYFAGALTGGYLLQFLLGAFPLRYALTLTYSVIVVGRFSASFLFLRLKEPEKKGREQFTLYSLLFRLKQPGMPSGASVKPR